MKPRLLLTDQPRWLRRIGIFGLISMLLALLPALIPAPVQANTSPLSLTWLAATSQQSRAVAWGDVDGDGDLDLAVANYGQPSRVYRNCSIRSGLPDDPCSTSSTMSNSLIWEAPAAATSVAVALVDVDGDGDLDLSLANQGAASQVYRNCSVRSGAPGDPCGTATSLTQQTIWQASDTPNTTSMAWGDVDGDGDLDLVLGNQGVASQIYRNDGLGGMGSPITWQSAPFPATQSLALADVDGDGDLDLTLGYVGAPAQLYLNSCNPSAGVCSTSFGLSLHSWVPTTGAANAAALAWADVDGDGDLDLAVGNNGASHAIFVNTCNPVGGSCSGPVGLPNTPSQSISNSSGTTSLAWGDLDGDGDSDLVVGNLESRSQVYRNTSGTLTLESTWLPSASLKTKGVAWGDLDNDGSLDLVLVNEDQPLLIYRNTLSSGFNLANGWNVPALASRAVAWGDVDGDGDLDLAIASNTNSQVLRNTCNPTPTGVCSQAPAFDPVPFWQDTSNLNANAIAWGDLNHDGRLDLAIGGAGSVLLLQNNGSGFTSSSITISSGTVRSLAWGDVNGDGDLDLAVGVDPGSVLYQNNCNPNAAGTCTGSGFSVSTDLAASATSDTYALAWGDMDGDGDLDLALANSSSAGQFYRNTNGQLSLDASVWQATSNSQARALAWGDVDADGDLDLVIGALNQPNQLYRNLKGTLVLDTTWISELTATSALAWGDVDADGDLDLLVANRDNQASQLYRNSAGTLTLDANWQPAGADARGIALADADLDGDLDVALAVFNAAGQIYHNGLAGVATPNDTPPQVRIQAPDTPAGNLLATARYIQTSSMTLPVSISDPQSNHVGALRAFYSLDGGGTWQPALMSNSDLQAIPAPASGNRIDLSWDTFTSGFFGSSDTVMIRLQAAVTSGPGTGSSGTYRYTSQTAGSVARAMGASSTMLFRVRGTQIRVLLDGAPVADALVYRLGATQNRGGIALRDNTGTTLTTNAQGYLMGRGVVAEGDYLAALAPAPSQPSGLRDARLFYTSPINTNTGQPTYQVARQVTSVQTLNATTGNPLYLFDLPVYVEWDVRNDPAFLLRLQSDLERASELLYDWTDGQAALGALRIVADGSNPPLAGIHVYATNRLRPYADLGGIAESSIVDDPITQRTYTPGSVSMGSVWSRYGGHNGSVAEDWARALAHEIGHYAFFLDDNYIGRDSSGTMISISTCPGAMSDPYRDDYSEFHPRTAAWDANCSRTFSQLELQRADWETIKRFYPTMNDPASFNAVPGPSALRLALTSVAIQGSLPQTALTTPIIALQYENGSRYTYMPGSRARAFLFKQDGSKALDLGAPTRDQVTAYGAAAGDTLCVYDPPADLVGCTIISASTSLITLNSRPNWHPDVIMTPVGNDALTISIPAAGVAAARPNLTLEARIFPLVGNPVGATLVLSPDKTTYTATLSVADVQYAKVLVREPPSPGQAPDLMVVADYVRVGSVPAASPAGPPNNQPCNNPQCRNAPVAISTDGQLMIYSNQLGDDQYYSIQSSTQIPTPPPWMVVVGQAYRVISNLNATQMADNQMAVTIAYLEHEMPAGTEGGLALYYWSAGTGWRQLRTTHNDTDHNEIAAMAVGPGIYALMTQLDVREGWNLISYPWPNSESISAATSRLNAQAGLHYTTIHGHTPTDSANPWKVYDYAVPEWVNDLNQLAYGNGYWFIVPPNGAPPQLNASLDTVPQPPATFYATLVSAASVGQVVEARSGTTVCATSQMTHPSQMKIKVPATSLTTPLGCGIPGQTLTFYVAGQEVGTAIWENSRPIEIMQYGVYLPWVSR
ncbi:proprotein convertase P [Oscillochloris trichoides DG-6]|uniref:Proprotein convertase P n=1 Tax=Oscillochloris trichoides DG-6 TaxID=765420 RepID=E1IEW0_9CHLR|nr:VCBS repeat-containing protein [Oscillochloris trichoides]EFO80257.1 proprotein convertase P [Oscillochloris trichoides DG-6]